jgi:TolB-like protein
MLLATANIWKPNESGTVKNLRSCERLLTELFEKHNGRLFNSGGDSFLAEFPSAVSAVECAVEFQNIVKARNSSDATTVKLQFRIGINSGDVIKEKDNLLGDGVNIAARLEALAQPGGIALSKVVYDYVKGKTKYEFNNLGIQKVKENAFHVFDVLLDPSHRRSLVSKSRTNLPIFGAIVIAAFVAIIAALYLNPLNDKSAKTLVLETSSKPRILVMPIKTSGLAEDQTGFGNGITESMIATLSGYKAITVLSSSTSYHAEKISMIDESIRDEFGVNYLIRGSMQVMGDNARLNLEITDLNVSKVTVS